MATGKYQRWLEPDGLLLLAAWARDGLNDEEIARKCGVNVATLYRWKNEHCEIREALSRGKEPVDVEVENATHSLALGYTVPVRKMFKLRRVEYDPNTGRKLREYEELATGYDEVHVPANVNAQKFWLGNRKPDVWRGKPREETPEDVRPDDGLMAALDEAAKRVCTATDDSAMLPESEDNGDENS